MPIRMSGMVSGLDTDAIVKELMSAQSLKKTNVEGSKKKLEWKKEKWEEMNKKLYSLYTEKLSNLKLQGTYLSHKTTSSDEAKVSASATTATNGSYTVSVEKLASAQYVTGKDIKEKSLKNDSLLSDAGMGLSQTITVKTGKDLDKVKTFTVEEDSTIKDLTEFLKEAGLNASFSDTDGRFYVSAKASGLENIFTLTSNYSGEDGLEALGLMDITQDIARDGKTAAGPDEVAVVAAGDARAVVNGATIVSSTNTITANGLTLELKGVTTDNVNITVSNDADGVYDKIKDFVKSYNELMVEMYEKYNAKSAREYAMLTDEDKESMSESQIELWENNIKDSLLRRDDTLNSLMSTFRTAMQKTVEIDGKQYSLASFGVGTGAYTEHGILHIDGDSEDGIYAGKDDKLKKAINDDPELVSNVFSEVMSDFYKTLSDKMSVTSISSALTFYNDKQIQSQIDDYETQINKWEDRLSELEDKYYKQFSVMESSMAKLQNQQNQLAGLLGMS